MQQHVVRRLQKQSSCAAASIQPCYVVGHAKCVTHGVSTRASVVCCLLNLCMHGLVRLWRRASFKTRPRRGSSSYARSTC
eukprot:15219934-Alexandrium_andersonii.AAC.1